MCCGAGSTLCFLRLIAISFVWRVESQLIRGTSLCQSAHSISIGTYAGSWCTVTHMWRENRRRIKDELLHEAVTWQLLLHLLLPKKESAQSIFIITMLIKLCISRVHYIEGHNHEVMSGWILTSDQLRAASVIRLRTSISDTSSPIFSGYTSESACSRVLTVPDRLFAYII